MNPEPLAQELLEMLGHSRAYTQYFAELGVETIELLSDERPIDRSKSLPRTLPTQPSIERGRQSEPPPTKSMLSDPSKVSSLFGELTDLQPASLQSVETVADVWRDIGDCTRCGLCEGRTQVVNTFGNLNARLMFVGEAPGADEDAQGKPFVGRAGQLLTKIIEAIGMKREDVLIGNVNRCRPPGNRQPTLEEAAICRPFLFREIAAVKPDVIVVMGNTALRNLLEVREGITRVRGKFQDFRGIKVMPTFHPAYLLRDPSKKRETWEDLKKVRDYLDNLPRRT
jgi:uracil-DNA glycosylase